MNFTSSKDDLLKTLSYAVNGIDSKPVEPALKCFLLDVTADWLTVQANNYQLGIKAGMEVFTRETGSTLVDAKKFLQVIKACSDEINFSLDVANKLLNVESARIKYSLPTSDADDFPQVNPVTSDKVFTVDTHQFCRLIRDTAFACSSDTAQPVYTGCLFQFEENALYVAATDKHRLAVAKFPVLFDDLNDLKAVIPADSLKGIADILKDFTGDININFGTNQISFSRDNLTVTSRMIDDSLGSFPDFKRVVPSDYSTVVSINAAKLADVINRVSLVTSDEPHKKIVFDIEDGHFNIFAQSAFNGYAEESVDAQIEGVNRRVAFNSRQLIEGLKILGDNDCVIQFATSLDQHKSFAACDIRVSKGDENFIYIVTPIRV